MADAIADREDVFRRAKPFVDLQKVPAVVRDAGRLEAETRERRRGGAANVELDHRRFDGGPVGELDDVVAALTRARPDPFGPRVLADVDARSTQCLCEQRGAPRMVGRVHLPRAHERGAHVETRVDLRELGA